MLRTAEAETVDTRVLQVFCNAFADDPFARWMLPGRSAFERHFERHAALLMRRGRRHGWVDVTPCGGGAAVWLPHFALPGVVSLAMALGGGLPARRIVPLLRASAAMDRARPRRPFTYLAIIGVRPLERGKGLGSILLGQALERCAGTSACVYLEASSAQNLRFYERNGFVAQSPVTLSGATVVWPMIRQTR